MKITKIACIVMITLFVIILGFNVAEAACNTQTQGFSITAPEDGEVIGGDYEAEWSDPDCDDGEVARIWLCWQGSNSCLLVAGPVDANDQVAEFDTTGWNEDRDYWLKLILFNGGGDFFEHISDSVFMIDNSGSEEVDPVYDNDHDAGVWDSHSSDNSVEFTWDDPDDNGAAGLGGFYVSCGTDPDAVPVDDPDDDNSHTCVFGDGTSNYFHIRAYDALGNLGPITRAGPYYIDTVDPWFEDLEFIPDDAITADDMYFHSGQSIGIEATVKDATSGVVRVTADLSVIDSDWDTEARFTGIGDYKWQLVTDLIESDVPEGDYRISVTVLDAAGNTRLRSIWLTIDNTAPVPTLRFDDSDNIDGNIPASERVIKDGDDLRIYVDFIEEGSGVKPKDFGADPTVEVICPDGVNFVRDMVEQDTNVFYIDIPETDLPDNGWDDTCDVRVEGADWANNFVQNSNNGQLFEDAFAVDNTDPVITQVSASTGFYNLGVTIYAGVNVDDTNGFAYDVMGVKTQDHNGDWSTHFFDPVAVSLCNDDLDGAPFDVCWGVELDGTEGQDARISVRMYDYAGHFATNIDVLDDTIVHTDFIAPSTPVIDDPADLTVNMNQFQVDLDTPSTDDLEHHWYKYQLWTNENPWVNTDDTDGFMFDLVQDFDNELCVRGMDKATNPSGSDCITVTEDSTSPPVVEDLEVFDSLESNTVTLTWSDVTDPGEYASGVDYYGVYMRKIGKHQDCFGNIYDDDVEMVASVDPGEGTVDIDDLYEGRTYCFAVVAFDYADNHVAVFQSVSGAAYPNEEVELIDDWNFISTPVILIDNDIADVFAPIADETNIVWYYDASGDGEWLSWVPGSVCTEHCLTTFDHGNGYLVDMNEAVTLELSGRYSGMLGGGALIPEYDAYNGWNMVGYTKSGRDTTASVGNYFVTLLWDPITVLTNEPGTGLVGVTDMQAGNGYWLNVDADGSFAPGYDPIV